MISQTVSLMVVLIAGCLIHVSDSELQHVRSVDESASRLRGRPIDLDESVRRRYQQARQLASEALRSRRSRDLEVRGNHERDGVTTENWEMQKSSSGENTCDVFTMKHLDECACYYAKTIRRLTEEQEEYCKTTLREDFDLMEGGCSSFVDIEGRFKISVLGQKMQETMQSCSALGMNGFSLGTEAIQGVDRIPCSSQICALFKVLKKLNDILGDIFTPTPTISSNNRVFTVVQKGYDPKVARLMAYNHISVVPATQSS